MEKQMNHLLGGFHVASVILLFGLVVLFSGCGGGGSSSSSPISTTFSISGTVSGDVLQGVTITLSGADSGTVTTDASGNYTFSGLADGSYTLTPSLSGNTFSPVSSTKTVNGTNIAAVDFTATASSSITGSAKVTTLAGIGYLPLQPTIPSGYLDGTGTAARFFEPQAVAVDSTGNVYVADAGNNKIRKITSSGVVTTVNLSNNITFMKAIAVDSAGNIYVTSVNGAICRVSPAGEATYIFLKDSEGNMLIDALSMQGIAVDASGNIFVAVTSLHTICKVTPSGDTSILAGSYNLAGSKDGTGTDARFNSPSGLALDKDGNVYVADTGNDTIRKIGPTGVVTTLAGTAGTAGSTDGSGSAARFYEPIGIAVDQAGTIYVGDTNNDTIRKITPAGVVTTLAGAVENPGYVDGDGSSARFNQPLGLAVDSANNIYVADSVPFLSSISSVPSNAIRKITQ